MVSWALVKSTSFLVCVVSLEEEKAETCPAPAITPYWGQSLSAPAVPGGPAVFGEEEMPPSQVA